ncbi:helix-turn-helix domain-containing protein [Pseudomonas sp. UBA1879]|uniref:helix-turn-helix domain-containing protein n=1 Tax=Pseudomonas sp. UBA1879 TaxID=1947305 RepID=UPI0025CEEDD3|nr:helix-turn-helix domain-containing protein [Pseudomonas sp. UBA1879]
MSKKRDLFAEMMQGVEEMAEHRQGKITLRSDTFPENPAPDISAQEIIALRERLHMSQNVFARRIRTSPSTLRNWEQEKSKPNAQAALLIRLVDKFPDMVDRLSAV